MLPMNSIRKGMRIFVGVLVIPRIMRIKYTIQYIIILYAHHSYCHYFLRVLVSFIKVLQRAMATLKSLRVRVGREQEIPYYS